MENVETRAGEKIKKNSGRNIWQVYVRDVRVLILVNGFSLLSFAQMSWQRVNRNAKCLVVAVGDAYRGSVAIVYTRNSLFALVNEMKIKLHKKLANYYYVL